MSSELLTVIYFSKQRTQRLDRIAESFSTSSDVEEAILDNQDADIEMMGRFA